MAHTHFVMANVLKDKWRSVATSGSELTPEHVMRAHLRGSREPLHHIYAKDTGSRRLIS